MNLSTILTAATAFANTPLGLSLALFLGVIAILVMRWAHINMSDLFALKSAVESVLRDPAMASIEAETASSKIRKTAKHIEQYLNVVGNGGSKLKKIIAAIKLFLK